jgi:hypothetical protein
LSLYSYSLDADDGIERDVVLLVLSPEEIYSRKVNEQELYAAVSRLPEKQAKRIYAHFFLGISKAQIARIEGVNNDFLENLLIVEGQALLLHEFLFRQLKYFRQADQRGCEQLPNLLSGCWWC